MHYRGGSFWRSGALNPRPVEDALVLSLPAPLVDRTTYSSSPIDMTDRTFLRCAVKHSLGSLADIKYKVQVWNGAGWVANNGADGSGRWVLTIALPTIDKSMLVGDDAADFYTQMLCPWRYCQILATTGTGSGTSSYVYIRAAAI
jgi:hypothetical protein